MAEFWFNTATGEVEEGRVSDWSVVLGPYPTREAATRALDTARAHAADWERETRAFARAGADHPPRWADFSDPLDAIGARWGRARAEAAQRSDGKPLSGEDRASLTVLGLDPDADRHALRKRYSELVRRYRPDRNGGDRSHEARLQEVVEAYQLLRKAPAFA